MLGASFMAASCADPKDSSLCTNFDQMVASAESVRADVDGDTAGEFSDQLEAVLQHVTALQELADGRYTAELDSFEQTLDDLIRTLDSVQEDAEFDTWAPLIEDSVEDVDAAAARLVEAIEPSCSPDVSSGTRARDTNHR